VGDGQNPLPVPDHPDVSAVALRALLVEDDEDQRMILELLLRRLGCEVLTAVDGREGLELFSQHRPELVVTDWQMPHCSGIELTQAIRAQLGRQDYCYIILMTARPDLSAITEGLQGGADSFLTKPVQELELSLGIEAARRILQLRRHLRRRDRRLRRAHDEIRSAIRQLRGDLDAAAMAQAELLPAPGASVPGLSCEWLFDPAAQVGGDMLGLVPLADDRLFFFQFDVTGHGVRAALLASSLHADLHRAAGTAEPEGIVAEINRRLAQRPSDESSATMVCGVADGRSGRVRLVRAGHPYPMIIRADGAVEEVQEGGLPLGYLSQSWYQVCEVQLGHGDRLAIHSDGLEEQLWCEGLQLTDMLSSLSPRPLPAVVAAVDEARTTRQADDDATLLLIERLAG
jgi:sigma-B regulation protein RsbU (phosphoserine phosphatase)